VPIYVYECESCHRQFEYMQTMSEARKTECEACGGALTRVIAPTAFVLKGGGWYKDLYSSSKSGKSESSETKTETKSETKTESSSKSEPKKGGTE
jgi:putative FmdB family regulatory protein